MRTGIPAITDCTGQWIRYSGYRATIITLNLIVHTTNPVKPSERNWRVTIRFELFIHLRLGCTAVSFHCPRSRRNASVLQYSPINHSLSFFFYQDKSHKDVVMESVKEFTRQLLEGRALSRGMHGKLEHARLGHVWFLGFFSLVSMSVR